VVPLADGPDLADLFVVNITPLKIRLERLGWAHINEDGIPISGPSQRQARASSSADERWPPGNPGAGQPGRGTS
jgi:hypothetical protein